MTDIIIHHYDASPFTQKTLRTLGLKNLEWHSVETPMILPKPDLTVLTGGYRGTPVMQIGANVYIDTQRIALELETRFPSPTLFPRDDVGLDLALVEFGDAFFRSGLALALTYLGPQWDEAFARDRDALFDDLDFGEVASDVEHAKSQLRAYASLLDRQLDDGRRFLSGDRPGFADIQSFSVLWFTRAALPFVSDLLKDLQNLPAWEARVASLGEGKRTNLTAADAHQTARRADASYQEHVDGVENFRLGELVIVDPDDSRRGAVQGRLVRLKANEIAVTHENETVGEVVVHFPRIGYRLVKATDN